MKKKAKLTGDIPAKILKGFTSLERGCFPNQLKVAEMTPVFKKEDELSKENIALLLFFLTHPGYLRE